MQRRELRGIAFGYPDLLLTRAEIVQIFGIPEDIHIPTRTDSSDIIQWHNRQDSLGTIFDTNALFMALGLHFKYVDIYKHRNIEEIIDLNIPINEKLRNKFDILIDPGTSEHIFNIGQSFLNIKQALTIKGAAIICAPISKYNHGFWNINPTAYYDFFRSNGFEIHAITCAKEEKDGTITRFDVHHTQRFKGIPEDCLLCCVAQKIEECEDTWPTQTKYAGGS